MRQRQIKSLKKNKKKQDRDYEWGVGEEITNTEENKRHEGTELIKPWSGCTPDRYHQKLSLYNPSPTLPHPHVPQ